MKKLFVTYDKKILMMRDMGGFPDERLVDDKTKVVVVVDYNKSESSFAINYSPVQGVEVLAHPELTEQQIDKALIAHLSDTMVKEEVEILFPDIMR